MAKKKSSGKASAKGAKAPVAKAGTKAKVAVKKQAAVATPVLQERVAVEQPVRLQRWNVALAALFGVQAAVVALLSGSVHSFQVMAGFLAQDPLQTAAQGHTVLVFAVHHLFDVNLAWLVAAFLGVAAIAHVLLATGRRPVYEAGIVRGMNPTRWREYALAGGLAAVVVAMLAGVQDAGLLAAVFGLSAAAALCFQITERSDPASWLSFLVGKGTGVLALLAIGYYLLAGVLYGSALPALVYVTFGVAAAGFGALAVLVWLAGHGKGKFANTLLTERVYMGLSLVGLSAVAWLAVISALK